MAGAAKPNVVGLGEEGRHIIVSENLVYPNSAPVYLVVLVREDGKVGQLCGN